MRVREVFLSTSLVRKLFWGLLLLMSAGFIAAGSGFYHLTVGYQQQATAKVVSNATRAFERTILDRLFAAEKAALLSRGLISVTKDGMPLQQMFRTLSLRPAAAASTGDGAAPLSRIEVTQGAEGTVDVTLHVPLGDARQEAVATLTDEYLWGHADTAALNICITATGMARHCLGADLASGRPTMTRSLNFVPYFTGAAWQVDAQATDEVENLGPVRVGVVTAACVILAVLAAAVGASVFLRRVTQALAALIAANRSAQGGQLASRIDTTGWKDELHELGESFNGMMDALESSFAYQKAVQQIDAAIVVRTDMAVLLQLAAQYGRSRGRPLDVDVLAAHDADASSADAASNRAARVVPFAEVQGVRYVIVLKGPSCHSEIADRLIEEMSSLAQRLVIAAETYATEHQLAHQATTDSLTGLSNRFGFIEYLQLAIDRGAWPELDVVYLDLNGFKQINDGFGHSAGDKLLCDVATRLQAALHGRDGFAARLGGDEFAFVLRRETCADVLDGLGAALEQPYSVAAAKLRLTGSFGIACYPEHGNTVAELLRKADLAMYRAKNAGEAMLRYSVQFESDVAARLSLVEDLRLALELDQLKLVFQPRVHRARPDELSAEVLLRWHHPALGMVSPARFIPLAEEHSLIDAIGDWVLAQACRQFAEWRDAGYRIAQLSVNVSPKQLLADDFFGRTSQLLETWHLADGAIELEVTEGALVHDIDEAAKGMQRLRDAGCHIAIDDFGVGFSALGYLNRLPFDTLKIDKMFVDHIHTESASKAIATAIVALAKTMGKNVVAEGVERAEQVEVLDSLAVDEYQGYFFSRPMTAHAFADMLGAHAAQYSKASRMELAADRRQQA